MLWQFLDYQSEDFLIIRRGLFVRLVGFLTPEDFK